MSGLVELAEAEDAFLAVMRERKFLEYLFAEEPEYRGAYGYIDSPFAPHLQREIAQAVVQSVASALRARAAIEQGEGK